MSTGEIPKEAEDEEIIDVGVLSEVQEQTFEAEGSGKVNRYHWPSDPL